MGRRDASGKTSLVSLVVMHLFMTSRVPIVVKVQLLQRRLLQEPGAFEAAWNYLDAFLRLEHDVSLYRMLRQAMMARRALLMLAGLAEGGARRAEIARRGRHLDPGR